MLLFLCSLISVGTGLLLGLLLELQLPEILMLSFIPLGLAWTVGEYILPLLIHLSPELYDLQDRVSQGLSVISSGSSGLESQNWRIYVSDDDAQIITAVGRRTLILTRGCYNLRPGEFRCALQEAFEQRCSGRSQALLIATIGNPFYLGSRILCLIGRLMLRLIAWPIGLMIALMLPGARGFFGGFRRGVNGIAVSQGIADWMYSVMSWLLIRLSNLMLYAYSPILRRMDLTVDGKLCDMSLRNVLIQLINANVQTRYRGRIPRENCIIYRTRPEVRIEALNAHRTTPVSRQVDVHHRHTAPTHPRIPQRPAQQALLQPSQAAHTPSASVPAASSQDRPRLRILETPARRPVTDVIPAPQESDDEAPSGTPNAATRRLRILP